MIKTVLVVTVIVNVAWVSALFALLTTDDIDFWFFVLSSVSALSAVVGLVWLWHDTLPPHGPPHSTKRPSFYV